MTNLNLTYSSMEKYLVLTLLVLTIITITSNASPTYRRQNPVSEADIREIKLWAKYASITYCDVTDWKCGELCEGDTAGTRVIKDLQHSVIRDNNGYVAINDKEKAIIIAFRGSSDLQSILQDILFFKTSYIPIPNAKVHFGFYATYNGTKNEVIPLIKELIKENPSYKVITTGHSLGGSLAVLQTLDLMNIPGINPSNLFTYTYGQPRIGNDVVAQFIMKSGYKFFRIVNKDDPIPYDPPDELNYAQYGPEYWINPKDDIVVCLNAKDNKCSGSMPNKSIFSHLGYFSIQNITCSFRKK